MIWCTMYKVQDKKIFLYEIFNQTSNSSSNRLNFDSMWCFCCALHNNLPMKSIVFSSLFCIIDAADLIDFTSLNWWWDITNTSIVIGTMSWGINKKTDERKKDTKTNQQRNTSVMCKGVFFLHFAGFSFCILYLQNASTS